MILKNIFIGFIRKISASIGLHFETWLSSQNFLSCESRLDACCRMLSSTSKLLGPTFRVLHILLLVVFLSSQSINQNHFVACLSSGSLTTLLDGYASRCQSRINNKKQEWCYFETFSTSPTTATAGRQADEVDGSINSAERSSPQREGSVGLGAGTWRNLMDTPLAARASSPSLHHHQDEEVMGGRGWISSSQSSTDAVNELLNSKQEQQKLNGGNSGK